jgi:hypothetical protein
LEQEVTLSSTEDFAGDPMRLERLARGVGAIACECGAGYLLARAYFLSLSLETELFGSHIFTLPDTVVAVFAIWVAGGVWLTLIAAALLTPSDLLGAAPSRSFWVTYAIRAAVAYLVAIGLAFVAFGALLFVYSV